MGESLMIIINAMQSCLFKRSVISPFFLLFFPSVFLSFSASDVSMRTCLEGRLREFWYSLGKKSSTLSVGAASDFKRSLAYSEDTRSF